VNRDHVVRPPQSDEIDGVTRGNAGPSAQPVGNEDHTRGREVLPCLEIRGRVAVVHDHHVGRKGSKAQRGLRGGDVGTEHDLFAGSQLEQTLGNPAMGDPEFLADVRVNRLAGVALAFDVTIGLSKHHHLVTCIELLHHALNQQVMHFRLGKAQNVALEEITFAFEQSEILRVCRQILFARHELVPGMTPAGPEGLGIAAVATEIVVGDGVRIIHVLARIRTDPPANESKRR